MNQTPSASASSIGGSSRPLTEDQLLRQELQATIAAHKELGPGYEQQLIDSFLRRLDQDIDARIDQRLLQRRVRSARTFAPVAAIICSLALAIPLIAIAGGFAGGGGIVAVFAVIAFLNVYYDRWRY